MSDPIRHLPASCEVMTSICHTLSSISMARSRPALLLILCSTHFAPAWRPLPLPRTPRLAARRHATAPAGVPREQGAVPPQPRPLPRLPAPAMSAAAVLRPLRKLPQRLWPNTLGKFWGLHALLWAAACATATASALTRASPLLSLSSLLPPLAAANAALATTLYRSREDANVPLAATAALYFGGHAVMLFLARAGPAHTRLAAALPWLRAWHVALTAGSFAFAAKAALKDRLFGDADAGSVLRSDGTLLRSGKPMMPSLVFVNRESGAKVADRVGVFLDAYAEQARLDGRDDVEVVDLAQTPPAEALRAFGARHATFRVLVCGGDGSASWVLGALEECGLTGWDGSPYRPAVGMIPLGTGNDLARVLGWGKSIRLDALPELVRSLDTARVALVDRWRVAGQLPEGDTSVVMSNYLSIGLDTRAALRWARLKESVPWAFRLRLINKLW